MRDASSCMKQGFKMQALLSFSVAMFETGRIQARVELAPPYLGPALRRAQPTLARPPRRSL